MASKPKYTQEICKLSQNSTRLKEQVAGHLLHYWKEDLKGGKSKICAVFLDGQTFQNVLTAEAWSDADQAHAEKHLKPLLGQVVALENGKITSNGKPQCSMGSKSNCRTTKQPWSNSSSTRKSTKFGLFLLSLFLVVHENIRVTENNKISLIS